MINKYSLYNEKGLPSLVREGEVPYTMNPVSTISPEDVARIFIDGMRLGGMPEEYVYLIFVSGSRIKGIAEIGHGSMTHCLVDPKSVFTRVLLSGSPSFILLHNHPNGSLCPSSEDIIITKRFVNTSRLMGVKFLDHIIVAEDTFISLMEEGYMDAEEEE